MAPTNAALLANGAAVPVGHIPVFPWKTFRSWLLSSVSDGAEIASFFARPEKGFTLTAVCADPGTGNLQAASTRVEDAWDSLTPECEAVHLFEREMA